MRQKYEAETAAIEAKTRTKTAAIEKARLERELMRNESEARIAASCDRCRQSCACFKRNYSGR